MDRKQVKNGSYEDDNEARGACHLNEGHKANQPLG